MWASQTGTLCHGRRPDREADTHTHTNTHIHTTETLANFAKKHAHIA